jgi:alkylation response protein AidB-like acyl-CoA dehydrogenase
MVVPVRTADGVAVHVVERGAAVTAPVVSLDMARQLADVTLDGASGRVVLADGEAAVRSALLAGSALLASEQVGVARWCLEQTVAYLQVRRQFGRVVSGFQALKHRLADLYAEVEAASAAARYAAAALAAGEDVEIAARVAASYCSDVAVHAAEEAVQLCGGIAMTWEHPAHLYLKRAKGRPDRVGHAERASRGARGPRGPLRRCAVGVMPPRAGRVDSLLARARHEEAGCRCATRS